MKADIQIFEYEGSPVSFSPQEDTGCMINATQMAKPFGKRPNDYLSLPSTNELIKAITRKSGNAENQIVKIVRGGLNPGTWLHEDIAIDFAQWLSVDFRLWVNDRIKELLRTGSTQIDVPHRQENPRVFFRKGIGHLMVGLFDYGEVFVLADDIFSILGVDDSAIRQELLDRYPVSGPTKEKKYPRMLFIPAGSDEEKIMLGIKPTIDLFLSKDDPVGCMAAGWLLSEIIPELKGEKAVAGGVSEDIAGRRSASLFSLLADVCKIDDRHLRRAMAEKICRLKESIN